MSQGRNGTGKTECGDHLQRHDLCLHTWGPTSLLLAGWWHPGERVAGAITMEEWQQSKGEQGICGCNMFTFGERVLWSLQWPRTSDYWLTAAWWWNPAERTGCYNRRKKRGHQTKADEGIRSLCLVRQIVEMHPSTRVITSGWWNSGEGIHNAMISPMSKGRNGIKEKGEDGTTTCYTEACGWSLTECEDASTHMRQLSQHGGCWNPGERAMGANEQRMKWHQSKIEEGMSGYTAV